MQEATFNLQTITPLFLAGADQTKAELRAPSIRGLMRYWLRALIGGTVGTTAKDLEKVRETETSVFGATDTGSAVSIKVSGASSEPREFTEQISVRIGGRWQATGKGYLLWSMAQSGRADRGNVKPARWYFPPGTSFQVTLSARDQDVTKLKQAIASLWLLTHFGGIGSRSRRCAGSIQAIGNTDILPFSTLQTAQALQDQLSQGIQTARSIYSLPTSYIRDAFFDALSPSTCRIWVLSNSGRPWSNANDTMQHIGESLQDYRSTITPLDQRRIFGLPLKDVDMRTRRASPLLLRVTKLQGEQYLGVAVLFKTNGAGITLSNYALIERWVTQEFPRALEVKL